MQGVMTRRSHFQLFSQEVHGPTPPMLELSAPMVIAKGEPLAADVAIAFLAAKIPAKLNNLTTASPVSGSLLWLMTTASSSSLRLVARFCRGRPLSRNYRRAHNLR
jgi:hypothetical protein